MKNKISFLIAIALISSLLTGCAPPCEHDWQAPACLKNYVCTKCDEISEEIQQHQVNQIGICSNCYEIIDYKEFFPVFEDACKGMKTKSGYKINSTTYECIQLMDYYTGTNGANTHYFIMIGSNEYVSVNDDPDDSSKILEKWGDYMREKIE